MPLQPARTVKLTQPRSNARADLRSAEEILPHIVITIRIMRVRVVARQGPARSGFATKLEAASLAGLRPPIDLRASPARQLIDARPIIKAGFFCRWRERMARCSRSAQATDPSISALLWAIIARSRSRCCRKLYALRVQSNGLADGSRMHEGLQHRAAARMHTLAQALDLPEHVAQDRLGCAKVAEGHRSTNVAYQAASGDRPPALPRWRPGCSVLMWLSSSH